MQQISEVDKCKLRWLAQWLKMVKVK